MIFGPRHGLASTYRNHGCRCDECREAQRLDVTKHRRRHGVKPIGPKPIKHGTMYAYGKVGCRCPECREANRLATAKYRAQRRTSA